jgi:hypothetical protein
MTQTIQEARFDLDRQLVELAAANNGRVPLVTATRFFLYPGSRREVLAVAELESGDDIQASFELPVAVAGEELDENAVAEMFFHVPSGARH